MQISVPSLPEYTSRWFESDAQFHHLYPTYIQELAQKHWTPLNVVKKATNFLAAKSGARILDIGSGAGKFCIGGAYYNSNAVFYGIEQRKDLVFYADMANEMLGLTNVNFICGNLTNLNFRQFDHFYFFNSFYENIPGTNKIDDKVAYSITLYNRYYRYLYAQLEDMPAGTRLVSYYCLEEEAPKGYYLVGTDIDQLLKYWIKI